MNSKLKARIDALRKEGRHRDAAELALASGDAAQAASLHAEVWDWDEAIAISEQAGLLADAFRYSLSAGDREARGRLVAKLETEPDQAAWAAVHAESKGLLGEAARLREAAGEMEAAAELYERAGELRAAAQSHLLLGDARRAGKLYERRLKEEPSDAPSALALGRILAQFGRWEHAVRALQSAAEDENERPAALHLLVACFSALGLPEAAGTTLDQLRRTEDTLPVTVPEFLQQVYGDERGLVALVGGADDKRLLAGRYRIVRALGAGATGRVLLAHDAFFERSVAIKVLNVGGGSVGRDAFVRFSREAKVAAGVSHPNVVKVFEFNPDGPFLVMEYMDGGTLEDRLVARDETPLAYSPPQTKMVAQAILNALEAVHRRGVVHRDLKPANVFFDAAGEIKIGDFGVAHLTDLGATMTGALIGTLAYMAPEQITSQQKPEASTDLYALGVIIFRCLTGQLPFPGPDFVSQHLEMPPPAPSSVAPALGERFDSLVLGLLSKSPEQRPASSTEALHLIRELNWEDLEKSERALPNVETRLAAEAATDEPSPDRYQILRPGRRRSQIAYDELLEREVELIPFDNALFSRIQAFARADGPFLQAVLAIDPAQGIAVLEHPKGALLSELGAAEEVAVTHIRKALKRLHEQRIVHGCVDAEHVVVGPARTCLRIALDDPAGRGPDADWAGLDAIGGRSNER